MKPFVIVWPSPLDRRSITTRHSREELAIAVRSDNTQEVIEFASRRFKVPLAGIMHMRVDPQVPGDRQRARKYKVFHAVKDYV